MPISLQEPFFPPSLRVPELSPAPSVGGWMDGFAQCNSAKQPHLEITCLWLLVPFILEEHNSPREVKGAGNTLEYWTWTTGESTMFYTEQDVQQQKDNPQAEGQQTTVSHFRLCVLRSVRALFTKRSFNDLRNKGSTPIHLAGNPLYGIDCCFHLFAGHMKKNSINNSCQKYC